MEQQRTGGIEQPDRTPDRPRTDVPLTVPEDHLERDSGGQVHPRYELVHRAAGSLAIGELAIEPQLGPVRVEAVLPCRPGGRGRSKLVRIAWADDFGPSRAVAHYPPERTFPVRAPARADVLTIRQGLDQAAWRRQNIAGPLARLIAAHLHFGPRSALYGFAVNGAVATQLYDELNQVATSRPPLRPWACALAHYCISRNDTAPVDGWGLPPPARHRDRSCAEPMRTIFERSYAPPTRAALRSLVGAVMSAL
jgi:hypothetical protein